MNKILHIYIVSNSNVCIRRKLDNAILYNYFKSNDCEITNSPDIADYIILSTCASMDTSEKISFKLIDKFSIFNNNVVVVGCLPAIATDKLNRIKKNHIIPIEKLNNIDSVFPQFKIKFLNIKDVNFPLLEKTQDAKIKQSPIVVKVFKEFELSRYFLYRISNYMRKSIKRISVKNECNSKENMANLRIAWGCAGNCSYCSIKFAIGNLRSKPLELCAAEYKRLIDSGYNTIALVAEDTGCYGKDINSSLLKLLRKLSQIDMGLDVKWEITPINPNSLLKNKSIIKQKVEERKIVKIYCPIQSGSNKILKKMNRGCNIDDLINTFIGFKKNNQDLNLITDMIIGFPSETDEDFLETLYAIVNSKFNFVNIHFYSESKLTASYKMNNKIPKKIMKKRLNKAIKILNKENISWQYT